MIRFLHLLALGALLGAMLSSRRAAAQSVPAPNAPAAAAPAAPAEPNPLPDLPRPPDQPNSLMTPAGLPPYACGAGPSPCYFEPDPNLVCPPVLPGPGWVADAEVGFVGTHVRNQLHDTVTIGARTDTVDLSSAPLQWTASPKVELGWRLPEAFGEFDISYRFLDTQGTGTAPGLDAAATLRSRFDLNNLDLDYASNEMSLWPKWCMKWRFGLRTTDIFFDSRADEPFAAAAAGSGIFEQRESNSFWGIGPHAAVELERAWGDSGIHFLARLDAAELIGDQAQHFEEISTTFATGETVVRNPQDVPMINAFSGADWRPRWNPNLQFIAGYQYEVWWKVGFNNATGSYADAIDQGVLLRLEANY